ncbi:MAG: histone deacetylase [Actinomycetota bacterium]|nr:histone deacetylase [Actinomycetota bacterium]
MTDEPGEKKGRFKLALIYHPDFATRGYPALRDRVAPAYDELRARGILEREGVEVLTAEPAGEELAARIHSAPHLRGVMNSGYYEISLLSPGAVIQGASEVASGRADNAFCFVGAAGHHASADGFWGFCYLNDVAMAVTHLRDSEPGMRFAIIDIDPHFGDGTRDILGPDADVLHVNFHSGYGMGSEGGPNNLDIALPHQAGDDRFLAGVDEALRAAGDFRPDLLFVIFGHDSHHDDYGAFELSDDVYGVFAREVRQSFPRRVCYVLSGGSNPRVARRAIGDVVGELAS